MRVVFLGTGDIALPSFRWLLMVPEIELVAVITQPDKPAGRKMELTPPQIKTEALTYGIPVHQPVKLRAPESVALVQSLDADVIVVMAYGQILPKAILDAPRLACLNLHASLLPRWRGASPIQAAIDAGDPMTGITVMYMDVGLDTGDILLMRQVPIRPDDTGGTLHDRLAEEAPGALAVALAWLAADQAPRAPQPTEGVTHVGKLTREHGELDFTAGRAAVERRIRAMNPWPAAATTLPTPDGPKRLKIFAATPHAEPALPPGEAHAVPEGLRIGTGDGSVIVTDLQLEGKKRLPAADWLRGHPLAPGTKLGA